MMHATAATLPVPSSTASRLSSRRLPSYAVKPIPRAVRTRFVVPERDANIVTAKVKGLGGLAQSGLLALVLLAWAPQTASAAYLLPPLPFANNAMEPVIDARTNELHHDVHHAAYVNNLNKAVANYSDLNSLPLHQLIGQVGTGKLPDQIETTVRNMGGGAWNHDLWWATLAAPNSSEANIANISSSFEQAIVNSYGSTASMIDKLQAVAISHFGSGWSWLVVLPDGKLAITDTLNQDNPLMNISTLTTRGVPILGLDVWEHSFYLKYGPNKTAFIRALPEVINWKKVSENYELARKGELSKIIGDKYDTPA